MKYKILLLIPVCKTPVSFYPFNYKLFYYRPYTKEIHPFKT